MMLKKSNKIISNITAVRRLRSILWFELSTVLLFLLNLLGPLTIVIVIAAALLFTPYLLYVLFNEKRFGWILIFFLMVVLPYIIIFFVFYNFILLTAWLLLPIILLYSYYFLLKYSVDDWLREYDEHRHFEELRRESEQRKKYEML